MLSSKLKVVEQTPVWKKTIKHRYGKNTGSIILKCSSFSGRNRLLIETIACTNALFGVGSRVSQCLATHLSLARVALTAVPVCAMLAADRNEEWPRCLFCRPRVLNDIAVFFTRSCDFCTRPPHYQESVLGGARHFVVDGYADREYWLLTSQILLGGSFHPRPSHLGTSCHGAVVDCRWNRHSFGVGGAQRNRSRQ